MEKSIVMSHVDHTQLAATATWEKIQALCEEAVQNKTASVCIPPAYVKRAADAFGGRLTVCTVIGFPLGYSTTETKAFETGDAIKNGAKEIDMVVNLGWVKDGLFDQVTEEIRRLKQVCGGLILKVIIETCYLTEAEKIRLCRCVTEAGADYIKTSTGFGTGGATREDVALMKKNVGPAVRVKASGGIRTKEDIEAYLALGADRIGASAAIKACAEEQ